MWFFAVISIVCVQAGANELPNVMPKDDGKYSIQFVGEDGKPIPEAFVFLDETEKGILKKAIFRNRRLNDLATLHLDEIPNEFIIGVVSSRNFYHKFIPSSKLSIKPGKNTIKVEKSGSVILRFKTVGFTELQKGNVLPYYLKSDGTYVLEGGIGLGSLWSSRPITVQGLLPGTYRFEVKDEYDGKDVIWRSSDVIVKKGAGTFINGIIVKGKK